MAVVAHLPHFQSMPSIGVMDERLTVFGSPAELKLFAGAPNADDDDSNELLDVLPILSNTNVLFRIANVLFYADFMHGDQTVFIGNDGVDTSELARMQIEHVKGMHATQWIPYDAQTKHTTNADQSISSIERM